MSNFVSSLLDEGASLSSKLWKSDKRLLSLSNDENVRKTGGEGVSCVILDMDDLVGTWVVLNVHEGTNTTDIVSSSDEDLGAILEFDNSVNLARAEVKLHSVVLLDVWVWVADGSSVVGHNVWDFVLSELLLLNLKELEVCFSGVDFNWLEASLDVIKDTEVLVGLWDLEHVHQAEWETWVSSCSVVNFDIGTSVSADLDRLLAGESVSKSGAEQDCQWDALSELVWSS